MEYEVHAYLGTVCIGNDLSDKYTVGEKRAILFYLKADEGSSYDEIKAEDMIINLGFVNVEFSKIGKISHEKASVGSNKEYYYDAIEFGSALVLYTDPI
ncbi:hypothetical protein [Mucilaginibacter dorajii]|uniref:Uncharacterized protein n=1 Tax=Mucilaginibacter dorajii TaxID=692994 RepID=A0ABP7Q188_9SPHI|nr:hypothetical protein [Mucilaginibacter dorajii]MCS3732894.1 hypothetical protein [Mucilaginibacter dorajii]